MRATKCNAEFRRRSHFEAPGLHPSRKFVTAFVVAGPFFLSLPRIWQGVTSTCARQLNVKGIGNPSFRSRWNHFCTSFGPNLGPILSHFCGPVLGSRKWPQFGAHPLLEYCFLFVGPKSWPENGRIFGAIFWPHFVIFFCKKLAPRWPSRRAGMSVPVGVDFQTKLATTRDHAVFVYCARGVLGPRSEARIRPRFDGHFLDLVLGPRSGHKHCVTLRCPSFVVQKTDSFWGPRFSPQNTTKQYALGNHGPCLCTHYLSQAVPKGWGTHLFKGCCAGGPGGAAPGLRGHPWGGLPLIIIYWRLEPLSQGWTFRA